MSTVKYFSGNQELKGVHSQDLARFLAIGGVKSKHNYRDSFSRMVGHPIEGPDAILPVTRTIFFKSTPSLHKCDARCMGAAGNNCECSCGGKNHGAAR